MDSRVIIVETHQGAADQVPAERRTEHTIVLTASDSVSVTDLVANAERMNPDDLIVADAMGWTDDLPGYVVFREGPHHGQYHADAEVIARVVTYDEARDARKANGGVGSIMFADQFDAAVAREAT